MEEHEIYLTSDIVRNYVELLCLVGEVDTANAIVDDCLTNNKQDLIHDKTLYRIATANADRGDFDTAKRLASMTSEAIPTLYRRITKTRQNRLRRVGQGRESYAETTPTQTDP